MTTTIIIYTILATVWVCGIPFCLFMSLMGDFFGTILGMRRSPGWVVLLQCICWPILLVVSLLGSLAKRFAVFVEWLK